MFFDKNVICKGKEYIKGKIEGEICFNDGYAMRKKREQVPIIPIIFNNHRIGVESIVNSDGLIIFEDCFNDAIKEIVDKVKMPCVILSKMDASVEMVSVLIGKRLSAKEGERVLIDGKKILKVG